MIKGWDLEIYGIREGSVINAQELENEEEETVSLKFHIAKNSTNKSFFFESTILLAIIFCIFFP